MKFLCFLVVIAVSVGFIALSIIVIIQVLRTSTLQGTDLISYQITLLGVIIAVITIGGAFLAIVGYREIKDVAKTTAEKTAKTTAEEMLTSKSSKEKVTSSTLDSVKDEYSVKEEPSD